MANQQDFAKYLVLIKKLVGRHIKNRNHEDFKDDLIHIVFMELYEENFFDQHDFNDKEQGLQAASYIKTRIKWRYSDFLESAGVIRKSTKKEKQQIRELNEHKAEFEQVNENSIQIKRADSIVGFDDETGKEFGDGNESWDAEKNSTADVLVNFSAEQILMAKQAYQIIKKCFEVAIASVKDSIKSIFIEKAFWEQEAFGVPLKDLANILGYENSNPTQDFNRFVGKVNDCTESSGIKVINPKEQVEFLRQILDADEGIV